MNDKIPYSLLAILIISFTIYIYKNQPENIALPNNNIQDSLSIDSDNIDSLNVDSDDVNQIIENDFILDTIK